MIRVDDLCLELKVTPGSFHYHTRLTGRIPMPIKIGNVRHYDDATAQLIRDYFGSIRDLRRKNADTKKEEN